MYLCDKADRIKIMRCLLSHFTQTPVRAPGLIGQMMGGSPVQTQAPRKKTRTLLFNSIIHLLHSDQFVLINPHKGTVSETKAPGEQWEQPTHPIHIHRAAAQVLPFPSALWPLVCPEGSSLWAIDGRSRTSGVHLKEVMEKKKISPHFCVNKEISSAKKKKKHNARVFYCIQVTPSINSETNLDVAYKEQLQKKRRGVTVFARDVRTFLFVTLVAKCSFPDSIYHILYSEKKQEMSEKWNQVSAGGSNLLYSLCLCFYFGQPFAGYGAGIKAHFYL